MRGLQEYKAEIFRRSEIRIARRKKRRRRAGILCIACMLCGTFALLFQRTTFPTEKTVIRAFEEQLQESAADSADVLVMSRPLNEMDISERELSETAKGLYEHFGKRSGSKGVKKDEEKWLVMPSGCRQLGVPVRFGSVCAAGRIGW